MGKNPIVFFEIGSADGAKTREFFEQLFDWEITEAGPA